MPSGRQARELPPPIDRIDAALAVRELMALARRVNGLGAARPEPARPTVTVSRGAAEPVKSMARVKPAGSGEAAAART